MEIDKKLTEINIGELIDNVGIPFEEISSKEIDECLERKIFLTVNSIYNGSRDVYSYKKNKIYDLLKISTIVNEIKNNTYNYNYHIPIFDGDKSIYDTDGEGLYHIRAFYHYQRNIYMSVNISG